MAGSNEDGSFGGLRKMLLPSVSVPCRIFLTGLQVARVIGKKGVLIKELREESGAVINIFDDQLPVAFKNRDERVLLLRGSLDQMRIAVQGVLRLAFGGVAAAARGDEDEHQRSVEIMVPEQSCAHIIGEKGSRISVLMEETKCDMHIDREPVSGLSEQRRLRVTGPTLRDVDFGVSKLQELLLDLTRFGTLREENFNIKEGPTAPVDLIPRAPREWGQGTGVTVAMLMPKEEVAWVIGKRGSKIAKLRERTRVNVNDAPSPPFAPLEVILEITGAPLTEELHVLHLVLENLDMRPEASSSTRLLVPQSALPQLHGNDNTGLQTLAEASSAEVREIPLDDTGAIKNEMRVIEVSGGESERMKAATLIYEVVEQQEGGSKPIAAREVHATGRPMVSDLDRNSSSTSRGWCPPSAASLNLQQEDREKGTPEPDSYKKTSEQESNKAYHLDTGSPPYVQNRDRQTNSAAQAEVPHPVHERSREDYQLDAGSPPHVQNTARQTNRAAQAEVPHSVHERSKESPDSREVHVEAKQAPCHQPAQSCQSAGDADLVSIPHKSLVASNSTPAVREAAVPPGSPLEDLGSAVQQSGVPQLGESLGLFLLLPTLEIARFLASKDLGIARRTGAQVTAGTGAGGEPILQIVGTPSANAASCYLVQEALWMSGVYAS